MKLIRITSDDDNGIFETQFNQSINIKPMSKIALNNLNANLEPITFASNASYVNFQYNTPSTTDDTDLQARIPSMSYNRNNYGDMMNSITDGLNSELFYDDLAIKSYIIGNQFRASVVDEKVNIELRVAGNNVSWTDSPNSYKSPSIKTPVSPSTVWSMVDSVASTETYENGIYSNYNVAKGVGYFRFQINKLVEDTGAGTELYSQGFLIGLSKTVLSDYTPTDFGFEDVTYGIGVGWDGAGWTLYGQQGAIIDDFNQAPTYVAEGDITNTVLEVRVNGSVIQLCYSIGGTKPVVVERTYTHVSATELYPFIVFHSNELYTSASYPETTLDPFSTGRQSDAIRNLRISGSQKVFRIPTGVKVTSKDLTFSSKGLASFLGYKQLNYTIPTDGYSIAFVNFQSDTLFYPAINSRNFILELITFNIDSYDSSQKQRRNILSSVISSDENEVITTEPNVIFLDMLNSDPLDIRNLTLRLVDTEYNPIRLNGKSTLTLLIANENEKSF